ncbi:hypothetical protein HPB47_000067, partial [Ixodes persulcatus]
NTAPTDQLMLAALEDIAASGTSFKDGYEIPPKETTTDAITCASSMIVSTCDDDGMLPTTMNTRLLRQRRDEELLDFANEIDGTKERGVPVLELILQSLLNVTSALLFGTRYPLGDPKREYLAKLAADFMERIHCAPIIQFKPQWLCRLEAKLPFTRTGAMRRCRLAMIDFVRHQIKEHEGTIKADVTRDFIDGFLKEVEKHRHDPNSAFQ